MGVTLTDVLLFGKAQSDDVDNATLVIYRRNILRWSALGGYLDVIVKGVAPLSLPDAIANSLSYVKAFGGTEQRNIPDNYIERQFIYMMDGSYLLTDIVPTYDGRIEVDFQTTSIQSGAKSYLGGRSDSYPAGLRLGTDSNGRFVVTAFSNNAYTATTEVENNTRYKFTFNNKVATLESGGSTLFTNTFTGENANGAALVINGLNSAGTITPNLEGIYLYSFKAWNGQGELVADYVPAVQKGTVPVVGFYDTVSGTFKTATAGTFAAGGEAVPTPDTPMDIVSNNGALKARHQSGLPLGYTRLEYLQSDGASYLLVPYRVNNKTVFYCRHNEIQNGPQTATAIFGVTDTPDVARANYGIVRLLTGTNSFNRMGWGDSVVGSVIDVSAPQDLDTWYEVLYDQNKLYQDNVLYATSATSNDTEWVANYDLGIFVRNGTSVTMPAVAKISSVWAKEDGEYKLNLVPAKRNSDNVLGMYDLVSGQFFTNQGTGDFVAGTAVSDPVEIYTDGTVETINVHGKNLFDKADITTGKVLNDTGAVVNQTNGYYSGHITVRPSTVYTVSQTNGTGVYLRILEYDSTNTMVKLNKGTTEGTQAKTFTTDANTAYVIVSGSSSGGALDTVQLETGSTATTYAPYFNGGTATAEMLLKVGDYQDVQSILDGVVTRNVGVKVLDGTETWLDGTSPNVFLVSVSNKKSGKFTSFCNYYTYSSASQSVLTHGTFGMPGSGSNMFFKDERFSTASDFATWLASQYNAGTPVIVVYPLETPTTESVTGQTLQVQDGDNIVEITQASLSGLELEASYQSLVRLTIQEVEDANLNNNVEVTIS